MGRVTLLGKKMRNSVLQLMLSEGGYKVVGLCLVTLSIVLLPAKKQTWAAFVWLPLIAVSFFFSLPAFAGCMAGGYGGLLALEFWPFPVAVVVLWFARPEHAWSMRGACGMIGVVVMFVALVLVPRPGGIDIRLRVADSLGRGVPAVPISCFTYGGAGGNHKFTRVTNEDGFAVCRVYWPEAGWLEIKSDRVRFQTANPQGGYVLDGQDGRIRSATDLIVLNW